MSKRVFQSLKITFGVFVMLAIIAVSVSLLPLHAAQAAPDDTSIMKKTLANAISKCYNSTYIHKDITPAGRFSVEDMFVYANRNKGDILVLDNMGGTMSCKEVFMGSKKAQGLNSLYGKNPTNPTSMGYTQAEGDNPTSTRCMSISYKHKSESGQMTQFTSNSLCFGVMSDGKIDKDSYPSGSLFSGECVDPVCLAADALGRVYIVWEDNYGVHNEWQVAYYDNAMNGGKNGTSWEDLYKDVSEDASKLNSDAGYANPSMSQTETKDPGAFASYTMDYATGAQVAFEYYTGVKDMDSQKFNQADVTYLLDKAYASMKSEGVVTEDSTCYVGKDEALKQGTTYAHYNESMNMWCPVFLNTGLAAGKTYNVVGNNYKDLFAASPERILEIITDRNQGYATAGEMCVDAAQKRYDEFVQAWKDENAKGDSKDSEKLKYYKEQQQKIRQMLNKTGGTYKMQSGQVVCLELPTIDGAPETPPDTSGNNNGGTTSGIDNNNSSSTTGGTTSDLAECLNNASSLGWILCPVLNIVQKTVEGFYDDIEQNWLPIDNNLISTTAGIYDAWKVFRDFANIVFVMMLIVIVLSQITGFGISNYGIKKMLPSLIIVAVLVNMSFLFCQLAVDVMNVAGAEVGSIFARIGGGGTTVTGGTVVKGAIAAIFSAAGIGALAYVGAVTIATNPGLLIPILIFGLGLIVTLFFFFAILAIRKAGIYATIILSPLAIVCYALPNTKNLFDKWKKTFIALLLVYPICQIVTGGGQMISGLMLNDGQNGFVYNVVAVILSFAPIFLIPSLVKGSMAAFGNIGAKISQLGSQFKRGTTGFLRKSDGVERAQTRMSAWGAEKTRGLLKKLRSGNALNRALGRYSTRKSAESLTKYRKMRLGDRETAFIADNTDAASIAAAEDSLILDQQQRQVTDDMNSLINGSSLDTTSVTKIKAAFEDALVALDANPNNEKAMIRAKALASLLMGKGDTGQSAMLEALENQVDSTTGAGKAGSAAMSKLAGFISYNDKWMGNIKGGDIGGYKFINDLASSEAIKSRSDYNIMGSDKFTQSTIGAAGDSWYDGIRAALTNGTFNANAANRKILQEYDDIATKALTNPRNSIKGERLDTLNDLRKAAYLARQSDWMASTGKSAADYESEFGAFQDLRANDELRISHKKAEMPAGWRRATAAEATAHGFSEGDWIQGTGTSITRLSTADANRANAIEQQNIQADIQNNL